MIRLVADETSEVLTVDPDNGNGVYFKDFTRNNHQELDGESISLFVWL